MSKLTQHIVPIRRINLDGVVEECLDFVAIDASICIFINDEHFRTLIATPVMIKELAVGHLFSEGAIDSLKQVKEIRLKPSRVEFDLNSEIDLENLMLTKSRLLTTACGLESRVQDAEVNMIRLESECEVVPEKITKLVRELNIRSQTFKDTGGTHSALLYMEENGVVAFSEDVGRHNAVDKVIGAGLLSDISFKECILISSGRLSGEIVLKAARAGVPILCSLSAPLVSGIKIACMTGVKLVGFIRGKRMNQYLCN